MSPEEFSRFSPQKRAKGLVYYRDRVSELHRNPDLAVFSATTSKVHIGSIKDSLVAKTLAFDDCNEAKEELDVMPANIKSNSVVKPAGSRRPSRVSIRRTNTK